MSGAVQHEPEGSGAWRPPRWSVDWKGSVGSTMDWAREEAREGAATGSVFAAHEQTAGRGRTGREWTSPPGGLYASLVLREPPRAWAPLLPLAGALAVQRGLESIAAGVTLRVKWPNDVLASAQGREGKIAGVLTEATAVGDKVAWVILGFGANVGVVDKELPRTVDPQAVGLPGLGVTPPSTKEALAGVLDAFSSILVAHGARPEGIVKDVDAVLAFKGEMVHGVRRGAGDDLVGVLEGVDPSGDVLLRTETGTKRLAAWDALRLRLA